MNQNNKRGRSVRTSGQMQGHARNAKQLQHAAGHKTDDSRDKGPSTRVDNGPGLPWPGLPWPGLAWLDKNKKRRPGTRRLQNERSGNAAACCMQHLVFVVYKPASSQQPGARIKTKTKTLKLTLTNRYSLAKILQDATNARIGISSHPVTDCDDTRPLEGHACIQSVQSAGS